jgi:hypothetical protein
MFFVGSAPLAADGHVNVSPKGPISSLAVLDDHTVAYLDVVGSGAETIAHIRENGRVVVMLCAFEGPPRILRLHGAGEVVPAGDERFAALLERAGFEPFEVPESHRSIVVVAVNRVADSCGYGVPLMDYVVEGGLLVFPGRELRKDKISGWRWFLGAWGVGTYRKNDQVDVAWEIDGRPRVAHALDIEKPG